MAISDGSNDSSSEADKVWEETGDVRLYLDALRGELEKKRSIHTTRSTRKKLSKFSRDRKQNEKLKSEMAKHERFMQRSHSFLAFVTIVESKGLPAHVIDEERLSEIVCAARWDEVPSVLCHMIREDPEIKTAFKAFEAAAQACSGILPPRNKAGLILRRVKIAEMYRDTFMQAVSTYARKLSALEASLDRLSTLTLDELESLSADGDDLSKRIASIGMKISDEIKRREAKKGAKAKDEKLEPVRRFALKLASCGNYPSRRQAVFAIKADVLDYARTLDGVSLSEQQAEKTIDGWLKDLGYTPSTSKQGTSAS